MPDTSVITSVHDADTWEVHRLPADYPGDHLVQLVLGRVALLMTEAKRADLLATLLADDQDRTMAAGGGEASNFARSVEPSPSPEASDGGGSDPSLPAPVGALLDDDPRLRHVLAGQVAVGDQIGWAMGVGIVPADGDANPEVPVDWWLPVLSVERVGPRVQIGVDHDGVAHDHDSVLRIQPVLVRRTPADAQHPAA